jgi:hypothetical protein
MALIVLAQLSLVPGVPRAADERDTALQDALVAARSATSLGALQTAATDVRLQDPFVVEGVWYAAALGAASPQFGRDERVQRIVLNASTLATLLALKAAKSSWSGDPELWALGSQSLDAFRLAIGIAKEGQPLAALLERRPSLGSWTGLYRYMRLDIAAEGRSIVAESSDTAFSDIGSQVSTRVIPLVAKKSDSPLPVDAISYSFPLVTMNHIILAAKAFGYLRMLPSASTARKYGLIVAAEALYASSLAEGNGHNAVALSSAAAFLMREAVTLLRSAPPKGSILRAAALEPKLTAMQFFGRDFKKARESYATASVAKEREADYRAYGAWGVGITSLALGDLPSMEKAFDALFETPEAEPRRAVHQYMLAALQESFEVDSAVRKVLQKYRNQASKAQTPDPQNFDRRSANMDLARMLFTIGYPQVSTQLWLRELERLPEPTAHSATAMEADYLRELGASLSDTFALISWKFDAKLGTLVRREDSAEFFRDFAPTWIDQEFDRGAGKPYGSVSPEEDRAT